MAVKKQEGRGGARQGAGRPRKAKAFTTTIAVKLDAATAELLRKRAEDVGSSVSDLVRAAIGAVYGVAS
jgi:Ribbon-helix-helix protein, copG family